MQLRSTHSFLLAALVAIVALFSSAAARADVPAAGDFSPAVWSDKADYSPGEHVILSGANWQPGESVHITVNDDAGSTWSRTSDVTADAAGTIADEFDLPSWFVAQYHVRAEGASGAVATYDFTDSNVKFDVTPAGTTTSVTETVFSSTNCANGTVTSGPTTVSATSGDTVGGVSATQSVRLVAAATSDLGATFKNWTGDITTTSSTSVCIAGSSGNVNVHANYNAPATNQAPAIASTSGTVTVSEAATAANTGTWSDGNAGDTVTLTASVGTVTKSGTNASGTWSWSYATTDGPTNSQTVTITADDGHTTTQTSFALTVNNVAPTVTAPANQNASEGASTSFNLGSFTDPGADSPWAVDVDWGDGSAHTTFNQTSTATITAQSHTYADGPDTRTVSVKVTDKDGGTQTKTFTVTVNNVAPTVTLSGANALSVPEGQTRTYSYTISDPGVDTVTGVTTSCGANGTKVGSDTFTNTTGSFQCTFPDGPNSSDVSASATDSDGATGSAATQTVAVTNVAPTVNLSGQASVQEGSSEQYTFTVSDPGQDTFTVDSGFPDCDFGATDNGTLDSGTLSVGASGGSFRCTFPDGPTTANVKIEVTDSDGTSDTASQAVNVVTVNNVAPALTAPVDQTASEGTATSFTLGSFTDPGPDAAWTVDIDWGDGTTPSTFTTNATGSLGTGSHTYADGLAVQTASVKVTDADGLSTTKTFAVTVSNVAPTVALLETNDLSLDEGQTRTYSYTISDPGVDTVNAVTTSCGANATKIALSDSNSDTSGSFECFFADGDKTSIVSASATDSDGDTGNLATQAVTIHNVAPTVAKPADDSADEGTSKSFAIGSFTDPGAADNPWHVTVDWGDSSTDTTFDATATGALGSKAHAYADNGSYTVTVTVTDNDGDSGAETFAVNVHNVAPTVALAAGNPLSVPEGQTRTYSYTISDPGQDDVTHVATSCGGDGTPTGVATNDNTSGSFECLFPDGPATSTVSASATDSDGDTGETAGQDVTVANVKPVITAPADQSADEGTSASIDLGSFADPGPDSPWAVDVDWGDGTSAGFASADSGAIGARDHAYADDGEYTVDVTVTDKDGGSDTKSFKVKVSNIAPTVTLDEANELSVNEGSTPIYSYTISDPGADTVTSVEVDCGDNGTQIGTETHTDSAGSFQCSFPDGPNSSDISVKATDSDGATGSADTQTVAVANLAPTVLLTGASTADEGTTRTYNFTVTDAGTDTFVASDGYPDCDAGGTGNGTLVADSYTATPTGGSFTCSFPDGPATADVKMKVADSDGATDVDSEFVHVVVDVANVAPTVTAPSDQAAGEGIAKSISLGSFGDPGTDGPWTVDVDWGDGSTHTTFDAAGTGPLANKSHTYADGPDSHTVTVEVTDKDGGTGSSTFTVDVTNAAPTVTLDAGNASSVPEGQTRTYSYAIADPGADTVASVATSCGANGTKVGSETNTDSSGSFQCSFPDGPSSSTVTANATDSDGDTGSADAQTVTITNVAPKVTVTGAGNVDEGSTHSYAFTVTDPGQDSFAAAAGYPDCDADTTNNGTLVPGSYNATATGGSFDCSFPDGPSSANVKMKVADSDDASGADSESVQIVEVANVPPAVTAPADQTANEGGLPSFDLGSFADPGADSPWSVDVDWGDGTTHTTFTKSTTGMLGTQVHTYVDGPATRTVTVKVTDKNGASDSKTFQVAVANVKPTITSFTGTDYLAGPNAFVSGKPGTKLVTTFSDPGAVDTWTAAFSYSDGSPLTDTLASFTSGGSTTHTFSSTGCAKTATVKVSDKDHDYDTASATIKVGSGTFQPPMTNQPVTDKLKNGQVLPVKVHIADCNGLPLANLNPLPAIRLVAGDATPANDDATTQIPTSSVSAADTSGAMRSQGNGDYIYNMSVNLPKLNSDYTVVVYPYGTTSPVQLGHVIQATK